MGMNGRLLRPRASGFNPSSIASLAVWFDANDSSTITTVSGAASQWNSKAGGYIATQTTANNRPAYSATALSGKPGLTFDGTNDQMTSTYNANLLTDYVTYAAVVQPTSLMVTAPTGTYPPVWMARGSTANGLHINGGGTGGPRWTQSWRNTLFNSSAGDFVAAANQVALTTINATTHTVRVNGVQGTQAGAFTAGSGETSALFQLCQDGGTGRHFAGVVSEVLMWSRTLTSAELRSVELYLARKWSVAVL